ncbi:MAG: hypothetical protein HDQ87_02705 [Clostridia bacterium]|nr:hypothetical protein [Clostridia bacterium]
MRITNGMMITSSLSNLNGALTRVSKYNNQLASNRKILTLSDSPVGVLNSMGARQQIRRLEQYQRNVDASRSWIQQAESAVTEMEELTISIRELLTDAMGTENAEDKAHFATQLREYTNSLLELCNSSNGSQYMFGGYNVTQQPFTAERNEKGDIIGVKYNGLDLTGFNVQPTGQLGSISALTTGTGTSQTTIADNVVWGGNMTENGTFKVTSKVNTITGENGENATELELTFTQVASNKTEADGKTPAYPDSTNPATTYTVKVNVSEALKDYKGADTKVQLKLTGENGESFGTISMDVRKELTGDGAQFENNQELADSIANLLNTKISDARGAGSTAEKEIPAVISSASVFNEAATTGPKTPEGLNWSGSIRDTTQKYSLGVVTDQYGKATGISFTNSYGSVVYTAPIGDIKSETITGSKVTAPDGSDLEYTQNGITKLVEEDNKRYTLDLTNEGYGIVTWTTQDMVDHALKGVKDEDKAAALENLAMQLDTGFPTETDLANFVSSAEYVASNIGNEASQRLQFEVGHNIMTDVTFTGIDLVGTGEDNLFKIMIDLADLLDANTPNGDLTQYITKLTNKQDQLLTAMVKSGNRYNKMETMVNRYKLDAINYEANRSNIEDIDQAEVIMQMKYSEAIYKQALAASAQIIQPTLMDFLR